MIKRVSSAAVIGAGIMGSGIAALLASIGVKTLLLDIVPPDINDEEKKDIDARNRIARIGLDKVLMSNPPMLMDKKDADLIFVGNLEDDFHKLAGCDWVVEAVVEDLKIKQELFARIEKVRKEGSIVTSNTSGIPLDSMSEGRSLEFRKHFLGTHFFNPVRYMKLLELVPGKDTDRKVVEFMIDFGRFFLGKGIVIAKDTPNFIANRVGIHGIAKIMKLMIEKNLSVPEIDALFGPSLGRPRTGMFKTADIVGIDILAHVAKNNYDLVPDDEDRDTFLLPAFVHEMLRKNFLGRKTQGGFYKIEFGSKFEKIRKVINIENMEYSTYNEPAFPCLIDAKSNKTLSEKINSIAYGEDKGSSLVWEALIANLIYSVNRIPEISDTIVEIDNAMKWGFNFEMGPFETWDAIGLERSVKRMEAEGVSIPEKIKNMISEGNTSFYKFSKEGQLFFDFRSNKYRRIQSDESIISLDVVKKNTGLVNSCNSASLIDLGDDIFCIEFHTKMNAINGEIVDFICECKDFVELNGAGMVIGNQSGGVPGIFSAGGDLAFMAELAEEGKYSEMDLFLKRAQQGMQELRYSGIPVVAAPYGLTLGGGCEVCLGAADRIVAHCDLYMGLVEVGVGLLPSGGGCLNLWKKLTSTIPEVVTDVDLAKFFVPAFLTVAMAKVSTSAFDARNSGFLGMQDRVVFNIDYLIGEAKKEIMKILNDGYVAPVKRPIKVLGAAARGMINAEIFNMRSGKFISEYDSFLAKKIAFVMSGGDVRTNSFVDEDVILSLERKVFIELWKHEKTVARVNHMLKTGKPLRN